MTTDDLILASATLFLIAGSLWQTVLIARLSARVAALEARPHHVHLSAPGHGNGPGSQ